MGWRPHLNIGTAVLAAGLALLFAFAAAWAGACVGLLACGPESAQAVGLTVMLPLSLTSNAFVPTARLSPWLRDITNWNPVSVLATALRDLGLFDLFEAQAGLLQFVAKVFGLVLQLRDRVAHARREFRLRNAEPGRGIECLGRRNLRGTPRITQRAHPRCGRRAADPLGCHGIRPDSMHQRGECSIGALTKR